MRLRPYRWNYNTRTGLGEITFTDGHEPKYEVLTGVNAKAYDESEELRCGRPIEDPEDPRIHRSSYEPQRGPDGLVV